MNRVRLFLISLQLLFGAGVLEAQEYIMLKGSVRNLQGEALTGAHVRNTTRFYGTFTDYQGDFSLVLAKNDSLRVTVIGYKPYNFRIPANLTSLNYSIKITLFEDTLSISGPVIRAYPATYAEFRREFIELKTPEEELAKKLNLPSEPFRRRYENPEGGILLPGPFSLLYDNFSKEARQLKKMAAINERNKLRNEFLKILSPEVLSHRYGLKGDEEIDALLRRCNITLQMIEQLPGYRIVELVRQCLREKEPEQSRETVVPAEEHPE